MTTIKYNNGKAVCPKCGGMLAYDARMTDKLPLGFGFVVVRFQIDWVVRKGWRGECMKCNEQVFAVQSRKHAVSYPKGVNAKIKAAALEREAV